MRSFEIFEKTDKLNKKADVALTHYLLANFSKRMAKAVGDAGIQGNRSTAHRGPMRDNIEHIQNELGLNKKEKVIYASPGALGNKKSGSNHLDHVIPVAQMRKFYQEYSDNKNDFKQLLRMVFAPLALITKNEHELLNTDSKDTNSDIKYPFKRYHEKNIIILRTDTNQPIPTNSWTLSNHLDLIIKFYGPEIKKLRELYYNKQSTDYQVICSVLKDMLKDFGCG